MTEEHKREYYSSIFVYDYLLFPCFFWEFYWLGLGFFSELLGLSEVMVILVLVHALGMAFVNFATIRYTYEKRSYITFIISVGGGSSRYFSVSFAVENQFL